MRERRKEPREGSEIEPEPVCIQTVGADWFRDCVPFVGWVSDLHAVARLADRGGVAKASLIRANQSHGVDPKPDDLSMARMKVP